MTTKPTNSSESLPRIDTGIPGMDLLLNGGFIANNTYLLIGEPGTGKTVAANQLCFHHATQGRNVVYFTLMAETHDKLVGHAKSLSFFKQEVLGNTLSYYSGYAALEKGGCEGLLKQIQESLRERKAFLLVIDGINIVEEASTSGLAYKKFLNELQAFSAVINCTVVLVDVRPSATLGPDRMMVDGVITLRNEVQGLLSRRFIEVVKFRGSSYFTGAHPFDLDGAGIQVFPRFEARFEATAPKEPTEDRRRKMFGITQLDEMLGGGVWSRSMTTILGAPGVGKTVLGMHFLHEGLKNNEPAHYIGFNETPNWLLDKSERVGINLKPFYEAGSLTVSWEHPGENIPERMAEALLTAIRRQKAQRVFFDGVNGLTSAFESKDRIPTFLAALTNKLRAMDVTALFSEETELFTPDITLQIPALGTLAENIILLRNVELRSQLYRLISLLKVREGSYDSTIREFSITDSGIELATTFESAEAILTGRGMIRGNIIGNAQKAKVPTKKSSKRRATQRRPR